MASAYVEEDGNEYDYDEVEEWEEEDLPYEQEEVQVLAPRIMPGQEDRQHWQAESAYGMMSTTAEGAYGKVLRKHTLATRTDEERFRDNVLRVAREVDVPNSVRDSVLKLIPKIPDIRYKSAAGALFGYMAVGFVGKKLKPTDTKAMDSIIDKVKSIKDKNLRISELDIVRYARMWQRALG
jgi:hypothetical protein